MKRLRFLAPVLLVALLAPPVRAGHYALTVSGDQLRLNGTPFKALGLRCSSAAMSDAATAALLAQLDTYRDHGVNTVSVYFMGSRFSDTAGYDPQGNLRPEISARIARIIEAADERGMVVIVGCLYWSTSTAKSDKPWGQPEVERAVAHTVRWLSAHGYRNVIVDPDNEGMRSSQGDVDINAVILAGKAVDGRVLIATNTRRQPAPAADLAIHFGPRVPGKPYIETEYSCPPDDASNYWSAYSRTTHEKNPAYYNYSRIGRYTEKMKQKHRDDLVRFMTEHNGILLGSTWLQCAPNEGVGGPFFHPGGYSRIADVNADIDRLHPDAGIRWWLEFARGKFGPWSPPPRLP